MAKYRTRLAEDRVMPATTTADAARLLDWTQAFFILAREVPNHLSLSQAAAFLMAAICDRMGEPITFTAMRDVLGLKTGRCLNSCYTALLPPTDRHPKRLGWLTHYPPRWDGREKPFKLTSKGRRVFDAVCRALPENGTNQLVRTIGAGNVFPTASDATPGHAPI